MKLRWAYIAPLNATCLLFSLGFFYVGTERHTDTTTHMHNHRTSTFLHTMPSRKTHTPTKRPHPHTWQPGVWIKTHPIPLDWSVWWRWLPLIGYHNIGNREEQLLPLNMRCCRPFNRNYIHHISRLADKLTPAWNRAKRDPRRVMRQVLKLPLTSSTHTLCLGCWLTAAAVAHHALTH